jgi:hypothetical protein
VKVEVGKRYFMKDSKWSSRLQKVEVVAVTTKGVVCWLVADQSHILISEDKLIAEVPPKKGWFR